MSMFKSYLDEFKKTGDCLIGQPNHYFDLENEKSLAYFLNQIPDTRRKQGKRYNLLAILCIVVWGYLGSIESLRSIQSKAKALDKKTGEICQALQIPSIPSHQTISRVLNLIKPEELTKAFLNWINANQNKLSFHLAIDGKSINALTDKANGKKNPPYIINVVDTNTRQLIYQHVIPDKRCEISVVPEVIRFLSQNYPQLIQGMTVTTDALSTQKKTFKACREGNIAFISPVKKNQKDLLSEIEYLTQDYLKNNRQIDYCIQDNSAHGRKEKRIFVVIPVEDKLDGFEDIECICQTIRYRKEHSGTDKYTLNKIFYQSTVMLDANEFASFINNHWQVEVYHNFLDMKQKEDKSTSKNNASANCSLLRKSALNILFELLYPDYQQNYNQISDNFLFNFDSAMKQIFGL